jgi:hypothetical protein
MRTRTAGGENLYNASSDREYNEYKLAVISYIINDNPSDIESMRIDHAAVKIRHMWKYSSDIRGSSLDAGYSANKLSVFIAKNNVHLTDMARDAYWNYSLAKAVENGQ